MKAFIYSIMAAIAMMLCGCKSTPEVYVIRTWEGHFMNTNDFYKATSNITLEKGETIWVLSNKTLLKTLENASGEN